MALLNILPQIEITGSIYERLLTKEAKMAVVGLGSVGVSLAMKMASKFRVIGYDICREKAHLIQKGIDPNTKEITKKFEGKDFFATDISNLLSVVQFYIITVSIAPNKKEANLLPLKKATAAVARNLKIGDTVVFENTTYPGCIEEVCIPILEQISGLVHNEDFKVGHSSVSIDSDNKAIKKAISGSDTHALSTITKVYESITTTKIHKAPSIRLTESQSAITNRGTVDFMVNKITMALKGKKPANKTCNVLIKGITAEENGYDIRNSKAAKLCTALYRKGFNVVIQDNHACSSEVKDHYGFELTTSTNQHFDAIVLAVDHDNYKKLSYKDYQKNTKIDTVFFDIKGNKKDQFPKKVYVPMC